jgi:hypothetical protein
LAQESSLPTDTSEEIETSIPARDPAIRGLKERIENLELELEQLRERLPEAVEDAEVTDAPPPQLSREAQSADELFLTAFQRAIADQGLLLPAKTFDLESSISFVNSSNDRIIVDGITIADVVVVGDIVSERVRRDTATAALSLRAGLPWDSQLELRFPYTYEVSRVVTADNEEERVSAHGRGDAQFSLSHQFVRGRGGIPDILAGLLYKSTTGNDPYRAAPGEPIFGTGFESLQLSTAFVKAVDPVVFFGGISYATRRKSTKPVGTVAPGDSHNFQFGLAVALNLDTSLSIGFDQGYTRETRLDGNSVPGSTLRTGSFSVGVAHILSRTVSLDVNVSIGLTDDSADSQVSFALPVRFSF